MQLETLMQKPPYSLAKEEKQKLFGQVLENLNQYHYTHCKPYQKLCDGLGEKMPLVPVRLFKDFELMSVPRKEIVKVMTSSGTTGQAVSKIFLDRETALNQTKALTKITSEFLGPKRLPMLILDTKAVIKDRHLFSARGAGILGFSMLGYDQTYALDEKMNLDLDGVIAFLEKHKGEKILLFGFTFMVWQYFYEALKKQKVHLDLSKGILIHGGGWKKLSHLAIDSEAFKVALHEICGLKRIHNYYGMVEQTGSIYMACECGRLHASNFSDIKIRKPVGFEECQKGEQGLIEVLSILPHSYPGHCLITEDVGVLTGEDDCPCGRKGKTFRVLGRLKNAEIRGCSDTYGIDH